MTTVRLSARLAIAAVALAAAAGWALWRPVWAEGASGWLAQELPWLARLLERHLVLLGVATCWVAWRDPRASPAVMAAFHFCTALSLFELRVDSLLGVLLALLTVVALVARPWPNRIVIARCVALAGLAIAIDAVAG